jgi:hypothetical protein
LRSSLFCWFSHFRKKDQYVLFSVAIANSWRVCENCLA